MSNYPPPPPPRSPLEPLAYAQPAVVLPFADKRAGLKAWGIVLIVFGTLTGCLTLMIPLGAWILTAVPANQVPNRGGVMVQMAFATLMYGAATALLVWIGIASIRLRRWVRPVLVTFSGLAIASCTAGIISLLATAPAMTRNVNTSIRTTMTPATMPGLPPTQNVTTINTPIPGAAASMWVGVLVGVGMLIVFGVVLPGAVFWFYRQDDTRLTLQFFDPPQSWSDRAPLPVIAVALTAALLMVLMLFGAIQQIFLAESIRQAVVVTAISLVIGVGMFFTAVLNFNNSPRGWVVALITILLSTAGWLAIIFMTNFAALLKSFGVTEAEAVGLTDLSSTQRISQAVSTGLLAAAAVGYMFWCRKFYSSSSAAILHR
ncbi:MAG TPA: hypothetical protein PLD59_01960 [Tepidisphaeraceae bacterium]|nr:hypothetical protein [Tepidisphaeraceae bacterium]